MKAHIKVLLIFLTICLISVDYAISATKTWSGNTSTDWNNSGNWVGGIIADSTDNVVINSNAPNNLTLTQNQKITNLTINGDTLDLGGYMFEITGTAYFNGGLVKNGLLKPIGSLCHFGGATLDTRIEASFGYFHMNSGVYKKPVFLTSTGAATSSSTSGNHFEDSLTITNNGAVYFNMGSSGEDIYDGPVILYNYSSKEIRLAATDTSYFNDNIIVNASGGVEFGVSGGVSILASGKTISVGTFSGNYLTLNKFIQLGNTSQTLTLSGTGVVSLENCTFNGNLTINAPGILTKTSTYYGTTSFNRTGSTTNFHSYGSNVYAGNVTWDNAGSGGRIRLASTAPDTYMGDATFSSTGGQDLQVAYVGDNTFAGNITINSNKVVFNTSTGKVTFTGTSNQTLNGSYNYLFKKLAINKASGAVTANTTLSVDDSLIFMQGNLITTSTNLLTMKHGSTAVGASNSSFVSGPVKKIGNTTFVFNVGSGTTYKPLTITAPSNTSDAFTAEYFSTGQTLGTTKDTTITFVSDCGYWKLDRIAGSSNITPKFAFDSLHCDYLSVKPVHIALWNGTKWTDKGEAVTESTNKTTSSAMTSYGYFAFAYDLKPGDAPQMPYPLTIGSSCSTVELQFTTDDIWFSFTPDSAVVKGYFTSPDSLKTYTSIKSATIYDSYQVGDSLQTVSIKSWPFDSMLVELQNYYAELTPSTTYLLKVSKFVSDDGPGIYDSLDYYLNLCLFNLRMSANATLYEYHDLASLIDIIGTTNGGGLTLPGDVVIPNQTLGVTDIIDLTNESFPLLVEEGVTLVGDYDLLSEPYSVGAITVTTSPTGLLFESHKRGTVTAGVLNDQGYMFYMLPGSTIRNVRLKGAMPGFQDFNQDIHLCAGIRIDNFSSGLLGDFNVQNCEIYNFSYAGIYSDNGTTGINVENCHVHHIRGEGGQTTAKGYGNWIQSSPNYSITYDVKNSIFDDCKTAIDMSGYEVDFEVQNSTIGEMFYEEAINKHNVYKDFSTTSDIGRICTGFFKDNKPPCTPVNLNTDDIDDLSLGDITLENSIFHKKQQLISFPYPADPISPTRYQVKLNKNTYVASQEPTSAFDCNYGGYVRMADNYIKACVWDWERTHDLSGNYTGNTQLAIVEEEGNNFDYLPGTAISNSPQPPEFQMEFSNAAGLVPGFLPASNEIPFIPETETSLDWEINKGTYGSASQAYVLRAKTSLVSSPSIANGYNSYDGNQFVTGAQTGNINQNYANTEFWDDGTNLLPGLYGIDVMAVDASSNSHRYASKWIHKPIIIEPADEYQFIFHIKDSYYSDLYGTTGTDIGVFKQVELNGNVIWREDIADGGDDWERIELDLMNDSYFDGTTTTLIRNFINTSDFKNVLTFSIGMPVPGDIGTGQLGGLRGLMVWVDDIYLKRFDSAENLCRDGDVEGSVKAGLSTSPSPECMFYQMQSVTFESDCFSLDDAYNPNDPSSDPPTTIAKTASYLTGTDRKSGLQSILLKLDGIHNDPNLDDCLVYDIDFSVPAAITNNAVISAGFEFDFRDFIDCADYDDLGYELAFSGTDPIEIDNVVTLDDGVGHNPNLILDRDVLIEDGGTLILEGISLMIQEGGVDPIRITIETGGTLIIRCSATNPTNLFACGDMWQGIVNLGGDIFITEPCNDREPAIWDAETAISSTGGKVDLRYVQFNENYIGVELKDGNFVYTGIPVAIRAVDFNASGGLISKDPHLGQQSHTHIILDNVADIVIGDAPASNTGTFTNNFSKAEYGIRATNSKATILNNAFTSINTTTNSPLNCTFCGSCIYFENTDNVARDLIIGGPDDGTNAYTQYLKNEFNNSKNGIFTRGNHVTTIQSNTFNNIYQGIRCNRNFENITIDEVNTFSEVKFGVILFNVRGDLVVDGNVFNDPGVGTINPSFYRTAITVQNPVSSNRLTNDVLITNNSISNYRIGIHGINSKMSGITGNTITYTVEDPAKLANYHGGIWLQNCQGAFIAENTISNSIFMPDYSFRGIDIENSRSCDINCNAISNIGVSINFNGHCDKSQLRENSLSDFDIGININNALIDLNQGSPLLTDKAWDNEWTMPSSNNYTFKVAGQLLGISVGINWYHQGPDDGTNSLSPNLFEAQIINPKPGETTAYFSCTSTSVNWEDRILEFGPIVGDSASYDVNPEYNTYLARTIAYQAMKLDSTIIYQSDSLDADFEAFFENHDTTNIGKFYMVESLIERETDSAMAILESISPENNIETYLIEHYQREREIAERNYELSSADSSFYLERSVGIPTTEGDVYYHGLGNLFIEQHVPIVASRMGLQPPIPQPEVDVAKNTDLVIFPNPTTGLLTIRISDPQTKLSHIEIYNSMGDLVISTLVENNSYLMDMTSYNQGIYFIRCMDQSRKYHTKAFNLLK
jgi:hypothetical protein